MISPHSKPHALLQSPFFLHHSHVMCTGVFFLMRSFFLWSIIVTAKAILFTFNHNPQSQSESPIWCDWLSTHSVCTLYNIWDVWLSRLSITDSETLSPFSRFFMLVLWYVLFIRSFVCSFMHRPCRLHMLSEKMRWQRFLFSFRFKCKINFLKKFQRFSLKKKHILILRLRQY